MNSSHSSVWLSASACPSYASASSCRQLFQLVRPPDPIPLLQPHYGPSSLLRIGPSQCFASVLSPRGFRRLCFSLDIKATGSCSSAQKPASDSRPLYAGRRLPSHQAPDRLVPEVDNASGFDDAKGLNDASSKGSLSFVSLTCSRCSLSFCSNAHHHGSLPQQLGVVWDPLLKADPEGPSPIFHAALRPVAPPSSLPLQHTCPSSPLPERGSAAQTRHRQAAKRRPTDGTLPGRARPLGSCSSGDRSKLALAFFLAQARPRSCHPRRSFRRPIYEPGLIPPQ